jgi:death-on-curing protein
MIVWISKRLALAIHDRQLAEHGGGTGVRDEALLDSALARPQQLFAYGDPPPDIAALAASLAFAIARNRPFIHGNTGTAFACHRVFLALNRARIETNEIDEYIAMLRLAEGSLDETEFAAWLRERLRLADAGSVNEPKAAYR